MNIVVKLVVFYPVFLFGFELFAQQDSSVYTRPFELEYSIVYNNSLILNDDSSSIIADFFRQFKLNEESQPLLTPNPFESNIYYPYSWDANSGYIYAISATGRKNRANFSIEKFNTGKLNSFQRDSIAKSHANIFKAKYGHLSKKEQIDKALSEFRIDELDLKNRVSYGLPPIYSFLKEYFLAPRRGKQKPRNVSDEEYKRLFTFDFIALDTNHIEFYFRDPNQLTKWYFSFLKEESYYDQWQEGKTYVKDTVTTFPNPYYEGLIPSKENLVFNAIADSMFFEGHFKIIAQEDKRFAINLNHGAIYHIGNKVINKVGQIDLKNYDRKLLGKKRFVNDKDNGRIIFISKVEQVDTPFPSIKEVLDDNSFQEIFGKL